jgi:hypothetical protein
MPKYVKAKSDPAELRAAPRSSLVLRTAKVVCQNGEYACLVRDVSASGVGLRFFHHAPPEQRIFLELANGQIHPIERAWVKDNEAGYRAAAEIDVEEFIAEPSDHPHRAIRFRLERPVLVTVDGRDCRARLLDISRTGAKLTADLHWPIQGFVRFELAGFPVRYGHVLWRKGLDHGIVFQDAMPLDELAAHLLALQPFPDHSVEQHSANGWAIRAA